VIAQAGGRTPDGPPLRGPLRRRWLHAIATEERAVSAAGELESLAAEDATRRLRALTGEREWVAGFHWPASYEPAAK
jgi:hypothetical protein